MLDTLQRDIAQKFGLGASAGPLLSAFLGMVDAEVEGGWPGLMQSFRNAGYGTEVATWLGAGQNFTIPPEAIDEVIGAERVVRLADATGVNEVTVAEALADVIPCVADALSPNGVIPPSLPGWAAGQLSRLAAASAASKQSPTADKIEGEPVVEVAAPTALEEPERLGSLSAQRGLPLAGWIAPAALAGIVAMIAWFATRGDHSPAQGPAVAQESADRQVLSVAAEREPQRSKLSEPTLQLVRSGGQWRYSGVVRDQTEKRQIEEILNEFGADGEMSLDLGVSDSNWTPFLRTLMDGLPRGLELTFEGQQLRLSGLSTDLLAQWKEVLQDRVTRDVTVIAHDPSALVEAGNNAAAAALERLGDRATPAQVLAAINLQVINFRPGSSRVPSQNADLLRTAARRLRESPGDWVLEIQGHSDSSGSEAANQQLSERRADQVRRLLISEGVSEQRLVAVGKGQSEPIASNDTQVGRFKNRRIEFYLKP